MRHRRMLGQNVLWQPGLDHAGIATQMVVERQLAERKEPGRRAMGREAFIERIWQWKGESGGAILGQLRRLGASCDWSRERFTMDDGLSRAVRRVFVQLHREGLIYRDKRLVNWDPKLLTAISDIEVEQREIRGHLWHFRYPVEGRDYDPSKPRDLHHGRDDAARDHARRFRRRGERLRRALHRSRRQECPAALGRARHPRGGRRLRDPEAGSGAVKITPAHDFNDFEVGERHGLARISVLAADATISIRDNAEFLEGLFPADGERAVGMFEGLDRFARASSSSTGWRARAISRRSRITSTWCRTATGAACRSSRS